LGTLERGGTQLCGTCANPVRLEEHAGLHDTCNASG
jgi:hypothetical protein